MHWSHNTHSMTIFFIKFHFWGRLLRCILVNTLLFALVIVIKHLFFVSCKDIFEKRVISLPWKNICRFGFFKSFSRFLFRVWEAGHFSALKEYLSLWILKIFLTLLVKSLKSGSFRCLERIFVAWDFFIFFTLLVKSLRNANAQVVGNCGLGWVEFKCLSLSLFYGDCIALMP